ncbi:excisionase [Pseudomonas aeruginosa]|nr:excisionase [Pseudomonas aeruginosa]
MGFNPSELLSTTQVATALGLSPRTLATWRSACHDKLPYIKAGGRIRYRQHDVAEFLANRLKSQDGGRQYDAQ